MSSVLSREQARLGACAAETKSKDVKDIRDNKDLKDTKE